MLLTLFKDGLVLEETLGLTPLRALSSRCLQTTDHLSTGPNLHPHQVIKSLSLLLSTA